MTAHELALLLAVAGGAVCAALAIEPAARELGVPTPLAFLLGGLALGELWDGSHAAARPGDIAVFGTFALVIVLLQGGFTCGLSAVRRQIAPVLALGVVGTAATFGLVAVVAHWLTPFDWTQSLLLGAVLSPTDPAAVFAAVSRAGAGGARIVRVLEAEAGFNDPVAIALTLALVAGASSGHIAASSIAWTTARELVVGSVIGIVAGALAARVLGPRWPTVALAAPLAVLAGAFATFGLGSLAHGSGFVAVYLYGLVLGDDAEIPDVEAVSAFGEQFAALVEIAMFVLLGVALTRVPLQGRLVEAALLTAVIVFVVRPALVYPALRAFRRTRAEAVFATAGGLKGAVPILLAALPLQAGLAGSQRIFALAGLVVLASLALQGPVVARLAPGIAEDAP
ncbi:MAG TPA: cation:proton antiporter [Gaiellales bacterium]